MSTASKRNISQLSEVFNSRFEKMLLCVDDAIVDAGRKTEKQLLKESSEQLNARRKLLSVEEVANKKRELLRGAESETLSQVEKEFHQIIAGDLEQAFQDTEMLMENVLKLEPRIGRLLDVLYTEACTITALVENIEPLKWLEKSIMMFVSQKKYRRVDADGHAIVLKTLRSALSFVGLESLKTLIPVLIVKHTNPARTKYTPDINRQMWFYTLATGNAAKALAGKFDVRPHFAFNVGLLANLGHICVVAIYLKIFDRQLQTQIIEAKKANDPNKALALSKLEPSTDYMATLWQKYSAKITYDIVSSFKCRWLSIAVGFQDYTEIKEFSMDALEKQNLHPLTKVLFCAQGYVQYKMMCTERLLTKKEALVFLRNFSITSSDMSTLSQTKLTGLELTIAGNFE